VTNKSLTPCRLLKQFGSITSPNHWRIASLGGDFFEAYFNMWDPLWSPLLGNIMHLTRPKVGGFLPSRYATSSRWAAGSRINGSDHPQATNTIHVGPTLCLGGTHVRYPRGFMRYSWGTTSGGTHTFWSVGPTILLWDSWLKIYVFSFCKRKRS
jgi:hypothetical protein